MLTTALLEFRARKGRVYPRLIADEGRETELAESLVARLQDSVGESRGLLESDLAAQASAHLRPRVAKGLVKLLLDRAEFEEPAEGIMSAREQWLRQAEKVRTELAPGAAFESYEAALAEVMDLGTVREQLYQDLPERRPLVAFKSIDASGLLARYDLAQVQGLLLHAERLELKTSEGDTPELRRLLRWMRFCRLVAEVKTDDDGWVLTIEGPAAVLDGAKKYGLQLASFFLVVPTLPHWWVKAEVKLPRRPALNLEISHEAGLRAGFDGGAGHVPPEMRAVVDRWADSDWQLDPNPAPRPAGVHGWCVPDLAARRGGREVAIELFHSWHHGALPRRQADLAVRPQSDLMLGVDRKLAKRIQVPVDNPQVFEFSGFPTPRVLKRALSAWWAAFGGDS